MAEFTILYASGKWKSILFLNEWIQTFFHKKGELFWFLAEKHFPLEWGCMKCSWNSSQSKLISRNIFLMKLFWKSASLMTSICWMLKMIESFAVIQDKLRELNWLIFRWLVRCSVKVLIWTTWLIMTLTRDTELCELLAQITDSLALINAKFQVLLMKIFNRKKCLFTVSVKFSFYNFQGDSKETSAILAFRRYFSGSCIDNKKTFPSNSHIFPILKVKNTALTSGQRYHLYNDLNFDSNRIIPFFNSNRNSFSISIEIFFLIQFFF